MDLGMLLYRANFLIDSRFYGDTSPNPWFLPSVSARENISTGVQRFCTSYTYNYTSASEEHTVTVNETITQRRGMLVRMGCKNDGRHDRLLKEWALTFASVCLHTAFPHHVALVELCGLAGVGHLEHRTVFVTLGSALTVLWYCCDIRKVSIYEDYQH